MNMWLTLVTFSIQQYLIQVHIILKKRKKIFYEKIGEICKFEEDKLNIYVNYN